MKSTYTAVETTGNMRAAMNYTDYYNAVVKKYGVELVGWTHPVFANPSQLGTKLKPLTDLVEALENDDCKFVRLTAAELADRESKYRKDVEDGTIVVKERKIRVDAGKRKGRGKKSAELVEE